MPGDLVLLRQGDLVPADAVLLSGVAFRVDQSALTGESVAVDKAGSPDPGPSPPSPSGPSEASKASGTEPPATSGRAGTTVAPDALTAGDSALYSGTVVVHGRGLARVTATGAASALGRIAGMLQSPHRATPLQRRMTQLSAYLAGGAVALCSVVLVLGVLRGQSFELMLLTAMSLVVAAVPESLPVVVTVSLALGGETDGGPARGRAAPRRGRDPGVGDLLATDKTGTLTQARMVPGRAVATRGGGPSRRVDAARSCCATTPCSTAATGRVTGDPTEVALLQAAAGSGVVPDVVDAAAPRVDEVPFDSVRKRMTTVHADGDGTAGGVQGSPRRPAPAELVSEPAEVVAAARWEAERLAAGGARVLAVAQRWVEPAAAAAEARPDAGAGLESGLRLLGLVALRDPLRGSAARTVAACRAAGIDAGADHRRPPRPRPPRSPGRSGSSRPGGPVVTAAA